MPSGDLERGWRKAQLIRELATAEKTRTQLAKECGVTHPAISQFAQRHATEIAALKERLDDEWAGLWIASKRNRIAECEADVEAINDALNAEKDPALYRAKLAVMRQVAEELGQLKQEIEVTGTLTYVVEGVNLDHLQ